MADHTVEEEIFLAEPLTRREREILALLADGLSDREIADTLTVALSTVKWYNKQIYGKLGVSDRKTAVEHARALGLIEHVSSQHTIPLETTKFIGREYELTKIKHALKDPNCRLMTLLGLGGVGKTRLALQTAGELAQEQLPLFSDGIHFIPLAAEQKASRLAAAIAGVLSLPLMGEGEPAEQLANYLRNKKMLLVLDNFEQLLEGAELVADLLGEAPQLKLLITSREALNLSEEWRFDVAGLPVPASTQTELDDSKAMQLFADRARHVKADFSADENAACIVEICRMVDGIPLAIELAASWIRSLTCADIADEIKTSLDFLETSLRNISDRHQSMRVIFDQSWAQLNDAEKEVYSALSVFNGGASLPAARQVAGATPAVLTSLVDKSMLRRESDGRYQMHELLKWYADQKLADQQERAIEVRDQYCDYYSELSLQHHSKLTSGKQQETLKLFRTEIANLQQAWEWNIRNADVLRLNQMINSFLPFFFWQGWVQEGIELCMDLRERLSLPESDSEPDYSRLVLLHCDGLITESFLINEQQNSALAMERLDTAQDLLDRIDKDEDGYRSIQAKVWLQKGRTGIFRGDYQGVRELLEKSRTAFLELGDDHGEFMAWDWLSHLSIVEGKLEEFLEAKTRSRDIAIKRGDRFSTAVSINGLAVGMREMGQLDGLEDMHLEAISTVREFNHHLLVGWMQNDLAWTHWYKGQFEDGSETALECIAAGESISQNRLVAAGQNARAGCLLHLGAYQDALALAESVYAFSFKGLAWELFVPLTYGEAALALGDFELAFRMIEESSQSILIPRPSKASIPLAGLSMAALSMGEQTKAEEVLKEALTLAIQHGSEFQVRRALVSGAALAAFKGEQAYAARLYHHAAKWAHIANSSWYAEIAGRYIEADALAEAENTPTEQTIWQAAESYLESL